MNQKPTVKEIQEEILILLSELDRVCRKNNIKYSLHGGTLLGAVRENGFIPWDDDADITMMREEYNRLIECFNKESKDFMLIESFLHMPRIVAYGHFPRPSGPRSPARQGHIKRPVLRLAEPSFLRPANQCC